MSSIVQPKVQTGPALLLVEPPLQEHPERGTTLTEASLNVTRAGHPRDIYLMRDVFMFSVVILSDQIGTVALRASAEIVRAVWPSARILILGEVPHLFDDHLYDEAVLHDFDSRSLMAMITRLSDGSGKGEVRTCRHSWVS